MKLGITGLPGSGKSTVFEALTQKTLETGHKGERRIEMVRVPDHRVGVLSEMYHPRKTIFAQVEYFRPGFVAANVEQNKDQQLWTQSRDCDALIHVIRNFSAYGMDAPAPFDDVHELNQELILADLIVVEKRLERIELEQKRHRSIDPHEMDVLRECRTHLENEVPLRRFPEIASSHFLKGFALLSAKPMLLLFNNNDEDDDIPEDNDAGFEEERIVIRGKIEQELAQMPEDEAEAFLLEFNIATSARDRVIEASYRLLGLISFFTVGDDEVRAWTIQQLTAAVDAAEVIHSDIKKGFIRAEVVSYDDLMASGSHSAAKKRGTVRLEGKTYPVQDGDIINFRFNV